MKSKKPTKHATTPHTKKRFLLVLMSLFIGACIFGYILILAAKLRQLSDTYYLFWHKYLELSELLPKFAVVNILLNSQNKPLMAI